MTIGDHLPYKTQGPVNDSIVRLSVVALISLAMWLLRGVRDAIAGAIVVALASLFAFPVHDIGGKMQAFAIQLWHAL